MDNAECHGSDIGAFHASGASVGPTPKQCGNERMLRGVDQLAGVVDTAEISPADIASWSVWSGCSMTLHEMHDTVQVDCWILALTVPGMHAAWRLPQDSHNKLASNH